MCVKLNKKADIKHAGQCTIPAGTQKAGAATALVTAPVYRIISTSKLALAIYWRKRP